jgi:high affinity sulfate transporter 1
MSRSKDAAGVTWPHPFAGLRGIGRGNLVHETLSGLTLAALVVPLNIGYAQVAGLPPTVGLYAALAPLIFFALFTTSRHVVGGPGPATAALVAAALAGFAAPGDPLRVQYALALALVCSLLFLLAWLFRLSFLENFLSRAVLVGFVSGLGVQVFTNQLRKILGVSIDAAAELETASARMEEALGLVLQTEGYFLQIRALIRELPRANLYAVAIGVGSFVMVRLLKRYAPKVPSALAALVVMTVAVAVMSLDERGVSVLGEVPAGLPALAVPAIPLADYVRLLPGAMALVAITLAEGLLLVRSYAQKYEYKADGNGVLFAYGVANAVAGVSGSMVTGNSVSRSAAMDSSGAKSQLPSLVAAVTVGVVLAFFTDVLALLPNAALAGIVASAVLGLVAVGDLRGMYRMRRSEFWIGMVCLLSVLALGPLRAVVIAFLMSIVDLLRRASKPYTAVLREAPGGNYYMADHRWGESEPGLIVYRFSASLYFANVNLFLGDIERLVQGASTPVRWFVLDADRVVDMDTAGAEAMRQAISYLEGRGVTFAISRPGPPLRALLENYELLELIGADRLFDTSRDAAEAFRQATG